MNAGTRGLLSFALAAILVTACGNDASSPGDQAAAEITAEVESAVQTAAASSSTTTSSTVFGTSTSTSTSTSTTIGLSLEDRIADLIEQAAATSTTSTTAASTTTTVAPAPTTAAPAPTTIAPAPTTAAPAPTTAAPSAPGPTDRQLNVPPSPLLQVDANLNGALLGVSTGLSNAERGPRFEFLEQAAGRQFDIGHVFHAWDKPIPTQDDLDHLQEGRILMISWNGADTIQIQNGVHDNWIRTQATAVRDLGQPVMLRWLWEMDGNRRQSSVHSGADFVSAWNHVRGIFDEVGATNAEFVWCPNTFLFWDGGDPDQWYPGDANVDWLCADGYNWADSVDDRDWMSFTEIFEDFVAWAEPRNLPIVIAETGSFEAVNDPSARANWLRDIPVSLANDLPAVDAVIYFDKDFSSYGHADWRVDTTRQSFAAWNEIANDPYLNPLR